MSVEQEVSRMTALERVEAMEMLWQSFSKEGIEYPSPEWHEEVLGNRAELIQDGKATWLSVDELQARLTNR